ncbi:hypothetical protein ACO1O0_001212 [Amphichorda felina]
MAAVNEYDDAYLGNNTDEEPNLEGGGLEDDSPSSVEISDRYTDDDSDADVEDNSDTSTEGGKDVTTEIAIDANAEDAIIQTTGDAIDADAEDATSGNRQNQGHGQNQDHGQNQGDDDGQDQGDASTLQGKEVRFTEPIETEHVYWSNVPLALEDRESIRWHFVEEVPGHTSSQAPVVPQASGEATSNDPSGDTTSNDSSANPASNVPSAGPPAPALPQNEDAISIRNTGDKRGLGVFSNHDFPNKHVVIFETPVLTTISISIGRRKFNSVAKEWLKLSQAKKVELQESFRKLRGISIDPPFSRSDQKRLKKFVAEYAFREMIPTDRAYIFKLACHINHACADCANCTTWVDSDGPHRISVKLRKPVRAGDELFIHYGKPLRYQCAVCRSSRSRRVLAVVGRAASNLGILVRREDSQTI